MIEDTSRLVNPLNLEEDINKHSDPFSRPFIDNYCSENEAKVYLTKEDIVELGFLRSNPERKIWRHIFKPTLLLEEIYTKDYSIKDLVISTFNIYYLATSGLSRTTLYSSTKPNKQDIQQVINNYVLPVVLPILTPITPPPHIEG